LLSSVRFWLSLHFVVLFFPKQFFLWLLLLARVIKNLSHRVVSCLYFLTKISHSVYHMSMSSNDVELKNRCFQAKDNSYSPYSRFRVGACLKTTSGKYFTVSDRRKQFHWKSFNALCSDGDRNPRLISSPPAYWRIANVFKQGANIENSSYGLTICAERTAIVKAVSEGERSFSAIAVTT
jgi:hypothetical protein